MIIDDRVSFIGSSNINDRSLLGLRDSEVQLISAFCLFNQLFLIARAILIVFINQIGVLIEDKEYVESLMNGKPWKAGKFSYSLRCSLWSEHLGLHTGEVSQNDKTLVFMLYLTNTCLVCMFICLHYLMTPS